MEARHIKVKKEQSQYKINFFFWLKFISVTKCSQLRPSVYHKVFPPFHHWKELIIQSQQGW